MLESGHPGLCMTVETIEIQWGDNPEECSTEIDYRGGGARCTRAAGHSGPHAAGWSLDEPDVCGETERGSGRVCLRQPHPAWPDAHNFGKPDEDMRVEPAWWKDSHPNAEWAGGPIGSIPDKPWWFQNPGRPADDHETIANQQDTEDLKSRRHTGGGVGYGEGNAHVSTGEVRGRIDAAIQDLWNATSSAQSGEAEIAATLVALTTISEEVGRIRAALNRLVAGGEENGTLSAAAYHIGRSADDAGMAAETLRLAGGDASIELEEAALAADAARREANLVGVQTGQTTASAVEEASNLLVAVAAHIEQAMQQVVIAANGAEKIAPLLSMSAEKADAYKGRL
jgi:hypothetical protein